MSEREKEFVCVYVCRVKTELMPVCANIFITLVCLRVLYLILH